MGAIDRNGYRFEPEFSVINQAGAIHVSKNGEFIEEIVFNFSGDFPELRKIEEIVDTYCEKHDI
ncbi:YbxH family protein [Anaerobacillus isosaccharinicus]|uniref:YbxH family protein n=1 Tax=Anaerobacillus isosaccharinicus TaxID=1532552 RepID=A0A1S2KX94_9BACI|nr:YbxH family protein [Anaerobacillus isosaccharinicus]MBA5586790.1 YbxH family protein [Anaerobacillus isosaccharinicus]QOY34994.1 YbxH family protein [Anaerobacillus isosaccharinicus]